MALLDPGTDADLARRVAAGFESEYDAAPAVVARAPGRVNLIGEHTDYNGGLCLPIALPHATYAAIAPSPSDRFRVSSGQQADSWAGSADELGEATGWAAYVTGVLWALRESGVRVPPLDVRIESTVPVGAGLSSSAALECAVAAAVAAAGSEPLTEAVRRGLIAACVRAETEVVRAPTGGMDQTIALLARPGHALLIDFDDDTTSAVPVPWEQSGLTLLVTDTRVSHALVEGGYGDRRAECRRAADLLGVRTLREADPAAVEAIADPVLRRRARHVLTENARVRAAVEDLGGGDWDRFGMRMNESHESMRDDFEISCPELDLAVSTALDAGALGARMTGGGFGGSAIALVASDRLGATVTSVDEAFAARGFAAPQHLRATPADRAGVLRVGE